MWADVLIDKKTWIHVDPTGGNILDDSTETCPYYFSETNPDVLNQRPFNCDYDVTAKGLDNGQILFGRSTAEDLVSLDEATFLEVFDGVPQKEIARNEVVGGNIIDLLSEKSGFLKSKGEARRELQGNAISVNKEKVAETYEISDKDLIDGKFLLLQKGKKNYFIVKAI